VPYVCGAYVEQRQKYTDQLDEPDQPPQARRHEEDDEQGHGPGDDLSHATDDHSS